MFSLDNNRSNFNYKKELSPLALSLGFKKGFMMKKSRVFTIGLLLIATLATPLMAQEVEISVEDQFFYDVGQENQPQIPSDVVFVQNLQNQLEAGSLEGAIELFSSMPQELADNDDLTVLLASLYISKGDYSNAIKTANLVLDKDSSNLEAMELVSMASRASGDRVKYNEVNKMILAKDPYNASVNIMQAEDYSLSKKYKLSRDSYKKVLKKEPENEDALYGVAMTSYYLDDLDNAKETCEQILAKDPDNVQALAFMGKLYAENNSNAKACEYMEKALEYGGDNYDYLLELGLYYKKRNLVSKSIEVTKKAVTLEPDYFLGYAYLAGMYDEMDDFKNALENYHKVIETNPAYYFAYEETGILEFHEGNYDQAIRMFTLANNYSPSYSYQMMIAVSYLKKKDTINAKKILAQIMKPLDRESLEYNIARFFSESYSKNAEASITQKLSKEDNSNKKGKMLFYMGLYYEINGLKDVAKEFYAKVTSMQAPMFFEYRLAEWGMK